MEDLVAVLHGRQEILEEVRSAPVEVREYLALHAKSLLVTSEFEASLSGPLPGEDTTRVTRRLAQIIELAQS